MTAWGAGSLVQMVSTIQSRQTAETVVNWKQAVCAGIFAVLIPTFQSLGTFDDLRADFGLRSLQQKIPFPAAGFSSGK